MQPWFTSQATLRPFGLGLALGLVLATAAFAFRSEHSTTGSAEPAAAAPPRQHMVAPAAGLAEAVSVSAWMLPSVRAKPGTASGLLASADQHRRKREFAEACDDYRSLIALGQMTADSWADFADAQASLTGRLAGEPARAVDEALALDPKHAKALWLKASLAHEEHRYDDALKAWRQLQDLVPPESSDARIVAANIAEAARLSAS